MPGMGSNHDSQVQSLLSYQLDDSAICCGGRMRTRTECSVFFSRYSPLPALGIDLVSGRVVQLRIHHTAGLSRRIKQSIRPDELLFLCRLLLWPTGFE